VFEVEGAEYISLPHGHGKSAAIFTWMLRGFLGRVHVVADPFFGSGAVLLACDQYGIRCVGAEIDPAMLATALERCDRAGLRVRLEG